MEKVAIITGASRGIGAATALKLAEKGYSICVNYVRNEAAAQAVVEQIEALDIEAISVKADISKEEEVARLFKTTDQRLGKLSLLINNAGILFAQSPLQDMSLDRFNKVFATNVAGTFNCCREAIRRMSTSLGGSGGVIVNVSSVAAKTGSPGEYIDYAASKGAIDSLTYGLASEVAAVGIRVNAVRPGFIYTDMHADGGEPERVDRVKAFVPLKRGGSAEEVANAICFLASAQSSYCTGSILDVAGGR